MKNGKDTKYQQNQTLTLDKAAFGLDIMRKVGDHVKSFVRFPGSVFVLSRIRDETEYQGTRIGTSLFQVRIAVSAFDKENI